MLTLPTAKPSDSGLHRRPLGMLPVGDSRVRRFFIGGMYCLGWVMAIIMTVLAGWQFIQWTGACLFEDGSWGDWLRAFLSATAVIYAVRWVLLLHWVIEEYFDEQKKKLPTPKAWPFVTVFLPAYNEEGSIGMTIESMLNFDYPHYEILVLDDGSKDRTFEIAKRYEGEYPFGTVKVLTKPNGGKWTAHNFGFQQTTSEVILCVDADSYIDPQSLKRGVAHLMADPKVDAVAGYTRVMNRENILLKVQALEFVIWNGAMRQPQSRHGAVMCIPGPLGIFRRSAMQRVFEHFGKLPPPLKPGTYDGPFEGDTFAEDFDLTIAIQMTGGKVVYDRYASCDTDCPDTLFALLNQRYRWNRGSIQVVVKILKRCWRNPSYRNGTMLAWLAASYIYDMAVFAFAFSAYLTLISLTLLGQGDMTIFMAYMLYSLVFKWVIGIPFIMDHKEDLKLLLYMPLVDFYGTFILGGAFVISVIDEVFKKSMRW